MSSAHLHLCDTSDFPAALPCPGSASLGWGNRDGYSFIGPTNGCSVEGSEVLSLYTQSAIAAAAPAGSSLCSNKKACKEAGENSQWSMQDENVFAHFGRSLSS